ncbi:MAG: hypothetical protein LUH03_09720 [Oscillospiraceae bacterium]|nr:hypothetical protein [Oscillospiraceae bacterium]
MFAVPGRFDGLWRRCPKSVMQQLHSVRYEHDPVGFCALTLALQRLVEFGVMLPYDLHHVLHGDVAVQSELSQLVRHQQNLL